MDWYFSWSSVTYILPTFLYFYLHFSICSLILIFKTWNNSSTLYLADAFLIYVKNICLNWVAFLSFIFKDFYLFLERGRERERGGDKQQCAVASHTPPTGDLAHNPGMCPDWESNQRPFGSQASTQSTEPHQPGQVAFSQLWFQNQTLTLK